MNKHEMLSAILAGFDVANLSLRDRKNNESWQLIAVDGDGRAIVLHMPTGSQFVITVEERRT